MDLHIRKVLEEDCIEVAKHRYFAPGATDSDRRAYELWFREAVRLSRYVGFVAVTPGVEVVAGAGALLLDWGPTRGETNPLRARVVNVFTEPTWRRRGLARSLLCKTLEAASAAGARSFSLGATRESEGLYRSLGFESYPAEMVRRMPWSPGSADER